jgi:alpha-ketoglutarate-dependent taurine dioxygenase
LYFYCIQPPQAMGATPLADTRAVLGGIDRAVRAEFIRRKWMVVRNYHEELGLSWQEAFNARSRDEALRHCQQGGIEARWDEGRLRTRAVRRPVHRHPVTGSEVWFNHITAFHVSTLPATVRQGLLEMFGEENLPSNTYYGDGGIIPDDVLDHLRSCYRSAATRFDYHRDDVLVVDNMLVSHGREPFTGTRKVAVAMAEPSSG